MKLTSTKFIVALLAMLSLLQIIVLAQEDIVPFKDYHVDIELLKESQGTCTTYVFPGISYCNFIMNQFITVDMPSLNPSDKKGADGVQSFITPKFPVSSIPSYKYLTPMHINFHNGSLKEEILNNDPGYEEIITYDNTVDPPVKLSQLKFNYYKNYTNPQRFEISIQVMGLVKLVTNATIKPTDVNVTDVNTIDFPLITNYTAPYLNESGFFATLHFPYVGFRSSNIYVSSPAKYNIHALNQTLVYTFSQSAEEILQNGVLAPLSVRFKATYPPCDIMLTPTITMWATTGTIAVLTILVVTVKGLFQFFQTKSRSSGYNPQTDY